MSARTNLAILLQSTENELSLVDALSPIIGNVQCWEIIERSSVMPIESCEVARAIQDGALVFGTTDKDPSVRMHLSRVGQWLAAVVSFSSQPSKAYIRNFVGELSNLFFIVAAAIGDELEVETNVCGGYEFTGDRVEVYEINQRKAD